MRMSEAESTASASTWRRWFAPWFIVILTAYAIYSAIFIYRTSFVVEGVRYFSLFDDAMVSMRYAANLAHHQGLVWNPGGERVEGFTNPLWVLYMAFFHLLPISAAKVSLCIQVSGALFVLTSLFFVRKLAGALANGSAGTEAAAVVLTAFYLPLNNWSLQGTEVSALTLLVTAAVSIAVECVRSEGRPPFTLYFMLGLATLVRLDAVVPATTILAVTAWYDRKQRWNLLVVGGSIVLGFLLAQSIFRVWYYGDIVPNTYHLKMTGYPLIWRITRGLFVTGQFLLSVDLALFAAAIGVTLLLRTPAAILMLAVFAGQIAYSVYVGGDAWESWGGSNRYITIAMPLFFVLLAWAMTIFARAAAGYMGESNQGPVLAALTLVGLIATNAIHQSAFKCWLLKESPLNVDGNHVVVRQALILRRVTDEHATVGVVWAGAIPYFAERTAVDFLGKNDSTIAHLPMVFLAGQSKWLAFYPGHLKWDYSYSIARLKPDVVVQCWPDWADCAPYLGDYRQVNIGGFNWYVLRDSRHIHWDLMK